MTRRLHVVALVLVSSCSTPAPVADAGRFATLTTISGGNGAAGAFAEGRGDEVRYHLPEGLALDPTGQFLFIADSVNHVIRQLELDGGLVTTVAGLPTESGFADSDADGGARLWLPRSLVLAPDGRSLYFTDTNNSVIRRLDLVTRRVTTEYGSVRSPGADDGFGLSARFGRKGFLNAQPWGGGLVIDAQAPGPLMYVADSANQTIRRVNLTTHEVTTIAGVVGVEGALDGPARMATFNKPSGLALQGGALYVTEANNLTVRKLDLTSLTVTTVAGKAPANTNHYCENIAEVIPPECEATDAPRGVDARFRFPFGVASDDQGDFFVVDSHNNLIRHFDVETTAVTTVAGVQETVLDDLERPSVDSSATRPGTFSHPTHALFVPPATLYVSDRSANCIRRVELVR